MIKMKTIVVTTLLASGLLITGCSKSPTQVSGGGDDFPNSRIASTGYFISENLSQNDYFSPLDSSSSKMNIQYHYEIPQIDDENYLSKAFAETAVESSSADTIGDTLYVYNYNETDTSISYDTCAYLNNDYAYDEIKWNETIFFLKGFTQSQNSSIQYVYTDGDDDGMLFNPGASENRAVISTAVYVSDNLVIHSTLCQNAGADNDFDTEADNKVFYISSAVTFSGDTLSSTEYIDADNDSYVLDYEKDSSVIKLIYREYSDTGLIRYDDIHETEYVHFPEDTTRDYIRAYFYNREYSNSAYLKITILSSNQDSLFLTTDTSIYRVTSKRFKKDTTVTETLSVDFIPEPNIQNSNGFNLTGFRLGKSKQSNILEHISYTFKSDSLCSTRQDYYKGVFEFIAKSEGNQTCSVIGNIDDSYINGDYTDKNGHGYTVKWDLEGNVISIAEK